MAIYNLWIIFLEIMWTVVFFVFKLFFSVLSMNKWTCCTIFLLCTYSFPKSRRATFLPIHTFKTYDTSTNHVWYDIRNHSSQHLTEDHQNIRESNKVGLWLQAFKNVLWRFFAKVEQDSCTFWAMDLQNVALMCQFDVQWQNCGCQKTSNKCSATDITWFQVTHLHQVETGLDVNCAQCNGVHNQHHIPGNPAVVHPLSGCANNIGLEATAVSTLGFAPYSRPFVPHSDDQSWPRYFLIHMASLFVVVIV